MKDVHDRWEFKVDWSMWKIIPWILLSMVTCTFGFHRLIDSTKYGMFGKSYPSKFCILCAGEWINERH